MPAIFGVIALAGLALGALGQLAKRRRGGQQQQQEPPRGTGTGDPVETTTASNDVQEAPTTVSEAATNPAENKTGSAAAGKPIVGTDSSSTSQGAASEGDPGLAARLGRESLERAKKKNREQDAASQAANRTLR